MRKRTLALRREALNELTAGELGDVVAAAGTVGCTIQSVPISACLLRTSPCPSQPPGCMP